MYLLILTGALFLGGGFYFFKHFPLYRLIQNTPTSKLRSAAQGMVELEGKLVIGPAGLQASPLTGKTCLWCHSKVVEQEGNNSNTIYEHYTTAPLYFTDETDSCIIYPAGAEITVNYKDTWRSNSFNPADRIKLNTTTLISNTLMGDGSNTNNGHFLFTEECLMVDDYVYVLGELQTQRPKEQLANINELQKDIISEWKEDYPTLLAHFDKDKDGLLNQAEWSLVRLAAQLEAEKRQQQSTPLPSQHHIVSPQGKPFIISTELENRLLDKLAWHCKLAALLCVLGAITSIIALANNVH